LARAVAALPAGAATALGNGIGWTLARVVRLRRTYVLETLARCFPEKTPVERQALYAEICRQQARNVVEVLRYAGGREAELAARLDVSGKEHVEAARALGKGVLVLIAHFGNYALLALQVPRLFGYPLSIIAKPLRNATLNELWWELQRKAGVNGIPARNAYRASVRALKDNGLVGFMLDQNRPAGLGVFVDFFGKPASTTPGLAVMSAHTGAPVLPVFIRREPDGTHRVEARPPLPPPADRRPETMQAYTAACTRIIEDEIRRHPEQWLWWHKRWKSRPAEEKAAAAAP
jgi:KDO2-lipid IV(A) lauroyltransferase